MRQCAQNPGWVVSSLFSAFSTLHSHAHSHGLGFARRVTHTASLEAVKLYIMTRERREREAVKDPRIQ